MVIEAKEVTKFVGRKKLIDQVSFQVAPGQICGFLGPNGAGKTTLIRMMTGLISPSKGDILIDGISVVKNRIKALQNIGAIVESPIFFPYLSGRQLLFNLGRLHSFSSRTELAQKVDSLLEKVNLLDAADQKIGTYSLGMKQRLGIAQALLGNPKVIILDEPANGLDPIGMRDLRQIILTLQQELGVTFFISSHLLDEIEQICSYLIVLNKGKKVWEGKIEELVYTETHLYTVNSAKQVAELISEKYQVKILSPTKLEIVVKETEVGELNKTIIQNGLQIISVTPKKHNLEDIFVELTKK